MDGQPATAGKQPRPERRRLREVAAFLIRWSGLPAVIRHTVGKRRATIVVYHDPSPEVFARHLDYLASRYSLIPLSRLTDALLGGGWDKLPDRSLAVTIDDGHRGNAELVSVCRRSGLQPTVFVCSDLVGTSRRFWWSGVDPATARLAKRLPHSEALDLLQQRTGYTPHREYEHREALTAENIAAIASIAEIGSHTCSHPVLTNCETDECEREIRHSKRALEEMVGRPIVHFSYPNGDSTRREQAMVAGSGYSSARTLDMGWVGPSSSPYRLPAICIEDDASTNVLAAQVCGIFQYLRYARAGSLTGRRPRGML